MDDAAAGKHRRHPGVRRARLPRVHGNGGARCSSSMRRSSPARRCSRRSVCSPTTRTADKHVHVVLLGQPELRERIAKAPQIDQRMSLRFHVDPLDADDVPPYVDIASRGRPARRADLRRGRAGRRSPSAAPGCRGVINTLATQALFVGAMRGLSVPRRLTGRRRRRRRRMKKKPKISYRELAQPGPMPTAGTTKRRGCRLPVASCR